MKVITAFGDSILKGVVNKDGHFSLSKESFSHLCENKLGIQIVNKAMMGCTIEKGEQLFERALKSVGDSTSHFVILEFGGNDCDYDWTMISKNPDSTVNPKSTLDTFHTEYVKLIDRIRSLGKEPIVLSLPPIDPQRYFNWISRNLNAANILKFLGGNPDFLEKWHEMYNLEVFKIASQCNVKLIDITSCFLKKRNYSDYLCMDGVHPNEKGHLLIAETICDACANFQQCNHAVAKETTMSEEVIKKCLEMRKMAYAPYSGFRVGAALLTVSGKIYTGCNIEVSSFSPTICAERTAIFKAVSEGEKDFKAIAIAGGMNELPDDYCPPCGVCREVMNEFCEPGLTVILVKSTTDYKVLTLGKLLPSSFKNMKV